MIIFGECDCCGESPRLLHRGEAAGCEAYACSRCRYMDPAEEAWEIEEEIELIEADPSRHGPASGHRALILSNLKKELARIQACPLCRESRNNCGETMCPQPKA